MESNIRTDTSKTKFNLCHCCLELICSKSLWTEYVWMEETEVYGEMLMQCFNITWPKEEIVNSKQICEVCITRLRNACCFRKQVIECQNKLANRLINHSKYDAVFTKLEEGDVETANEDDGNLESSADESQNVEKENFLKRLNTYRRNRLKRGISNKVMVEKKQKPDGRKLAHQTKKFTKPRENVRLLLQNSTICPFKSTKGHFNCFYCKKQYVIFDELRIHTREVHASVTLATLLKSINRPHDRVKADLSNITCKICTEKLNDINDLIHHLTEKHGIKFNNESQIKPLDCILGYDLSGGKYRCFVCKTDFLFFKTLTKHMNEHSTNYICDVCGKCFVLSERLKSHKRFHDSNTAVKCDTCGKVCASNILLNSHIQFAHKNRAFICSICNETFRTYRLRMQHLVQTHGRTPLNFNCKLCTKKFLTSTGLRNHMRREHFKITKEPKHECLECGRMFKSKYQLENHAVVHSGEKNHECEVCHKKYTRVKTLREHLKIHKNDRRWSCAACAQLFVQKCSLKNHIRVHHVDTDIEQLIVYKKDR